MTSKISGVDALGLAAQRLKEGGIVALPTETVYGLGVDAENEAAIARMYEIKGRPKDHPVIVHIADFQDLSYWTTQIPDYAARLAKAFWPGPMTLILPRSGKAEDFITGGQEFVGVRIPAHPIALQLLRNFRELGGHGVAAPSANRFGEVSPTSAQHVINDLGDLLGDSDLVIDGGESVVGVESTIIDCSRALPRILRLGAITEAMIEEVTPIDPDADLAEIRVSGSLAKHYSPRAKVMIDVVPEPGDGVIALATFDTQDDVIRLSAPASIEEFARNLYGAFRKADSMGLERVVVILPHGDGLAAAIRDRVSRAATM
jgi:L-threonylcarbamoyladenylate synthase